MASPALTGAIRQDKNRQRNNGLRTIRVISPADLTSRRRSDPGGFSVSQPVCKAGALRHRGAACGLDTGRKTDRGLGIGATADSGICRLLPLVFPVAELDPQAPHPRGLIQGLNGLADLRRGIQESDNSGGG